MQSNGADALGTQPAPSEFDDNVACINPAIFTFTRRQYIKGIVSREVGYNPAQNHELELQLLCTIGANSITTYELLMDTAGNSTINRWNGALNDVSFLSPAGSGIGAIADGDEIHFRVDENGNFTAFKNGASALTLTDATYTSGTPGIAAFWRPHASIVIASLGFKSIETGLW